MQLGASGTLSDVPRVFEREELADPQESSF